MKSAKERAEEIYEILAEKLYLQIGCRDFFIPLIFAELESYAEERTYQVSNDLMEHYGNLIKQKMAEARAEGRRAGRLEAIEEAAKVAERCIEHYSKDEPMVVLHSNVFKMIRALKESEI